MLTFSSFPVGHTGTLPPKLVTRDEVIAFAREFDPQPMHLDEAAAAKTLLGGVAASGWHTCAMLMRMIWDGFLKDTASVGSPGLQEVRWLKPVRPGDTLTASYEVKDARVSKSRPDMGVCRFVYDVRNQDGVSVMTWDATHFLLAASDSRSGSRPDAAGTPNGGSEEASQARKATAAGGRLPERESPAAGKDSGRLPERESPAAIKKIDLGAHTFSAETIKAFARLYDPQTFHLDEVAAEKSVFGGLCASGWHTAAIWMKLMVAHEARLAAEITARGERPGRLGPSPGFRDMRFLEPVRPGDTIAYSSRALRTEDWPGRPNWGLLVMSNDGCNQHGRVVFSFEGRVLVERRGPAAA